MLAAVVFICRMATSLLCPMAILPVTKPQKSAEVFPLSILLKKLLILPNKQKSPLLADSFAGMSLLILSAAALTVTHLTSARLVEPIRLFISQIIAAKDWKALVEAVVMQGMVLVLHYTMH